MRRLTLIGLILIVLGLLGFIFPRITFTEEETALDLGPVEVEAERERAITIPDLASGATVAAGVVLVVVGAGRKQ